MEYACMVHREAKRIGETLGLGGKDLRGQVRIETLLAGAEERLRRAGLDDSRMEAERLLGEFLGMSRSELFLHAGDRVTAADLVRFRRVLERRCRREPLQYIFGSLEFWSLEFVVSPAVLVPRPETEFLLEHALATVRAEPGPPPRLALDLCTGSGVIAVVLALELGCPVLAVDCSAAALAVARRNVVRHRVADRVMPLCADLLSAVSSRPCFDLLISNPPYVAEHELERLEPEVRQWEPRLALAGGADGLDVIRRIAAGSARCLRPGGWLFMEIGCDQRGPVLSLFSRQEYGFADVAVFPDLAGRPRVLQARKRCGAV